MLGLADQVSRDQFRIRISVGNDHTIGRAGDHVDANLAEENALGLGNVLIARPDDNISLLHPKQAVRDRGDALYATHVQYNICAAQVHRVKIAGGMPTPGRGGEQAAICDTPATFAVVIVMIALAT